MKQRSNNAKSIDAAFALKYFQSEPRLRSPKMEVLLPVEQSAASGYDHTSGKEEPRSNYSRRKYHCVHNCARQFNWKAAET